MCGVPGCRNETYPNFLGKPIFLGTTEIVVLWFAHTVPDTPSCPSNPAPSLRRLGKPMALQLEGHVKRSTIKQTVMTTVYGVTAYGAKHRAGRQGPNLPVLMGGPAS